MRKGAEQGQLVRAGKEVRTFTKNVKVGQSSDPDQAGRPKDCGRDGGKEEAGGSRRAGSCGFTKRNRAEGAKPTARLCVAIRALA